MPTAKSRSFVTIVRLSLGALALASLAACGAAPVPQGIQDPHEADNRQTHAFNKALDKAVLRPVSVAYSGVMPDDLESGVNRFSDNLGLPGVVVNDILQGNLGDALHNTVRFVTNSTLGIGGLFDAAADLGLEERDTDFGETLHVWGVGEGDYVELPVLGPSTERDAVGEVVDFVLDPLGRVLSAPSNRIKTGTRVAKVLSSRGRFSDTVDGVLYDSADSYAQARVIYLQNRRFELGQDSPADAADPFALDTEGF